VILNLHINRLILDNVSIPQEARATFEAAVSSELIRLLALDGTRVRMTSASSSHLVRGSNIVVSDAPEPVCLGWQVAGSVHRGIAK
jgi:hypothetical protein